MGDRLRVAVEDPDGGAIVVVPRPDPDLAAAAAPAVRRLLADADAAGIDRDTLTALLAEHVADTRAYVREAERRGVLPL